MQCVWTIVSALIGLFLWSPFLETKYKGQRRSLLWSNSCKGLWRWILFHLSGLFFSPSFSIYCRAESNFPAHVYHSFLTAIIFKGMGPIHPQILAPVPLNSRTLFFPPHQRRISGHCCASPRFNLCPFVFFFRWVISAGGICRQSLSCLTHRVDARCWAPGSWASAASKSAQLRDVHLLMCLMSAHQCWCGERNG